MSDKNLELLVLPGGEVKYFEDGEQELGIIKGDAIVFGSPEQPDRSKKRDFFTEDTLVRKYSDTFTVELFHEHGDIYSLPIGEAVITKSVDGWTTECKLDLEDPFGKHIYEDMKKGGYGFSTGALSHLVIRESKANNTNHIKQWIAGELSVTKRPAEERTYGLTVKSAHLAETIKSLQEEYKEDTKSEDHDSSTTQIDLPEPTRQNVINFGKSLIKVEDLDEKGLEARPHVTVKYGIHSDSADEFKTLVESQKQFNLTLGKVSIFEIEGKTYDVVKVDVVSDELKSLGEESKSLNKLIKDNSENTETNPEYVPHITLGYVKKGEGQKYVGDATLEGTTVSAKSVTFITHDGHETLIELKGEDDKPEDEESKFLILTGTGGNDGLLSDMLAPISDTITKLRTINSLLPKEYWGDWTFISDIVYSLESAQLKILQINALLNMDESFFKSKDITKSALVAETLKTNLTANTSDDGVALKNQIAKLNKELEDLKSSIQKEKPIEPDTRGDDSPDSLSAEARQIKLSELEGFLSSDIQLQIIQ